MSFGTLGYPIYPNLIQEIDVVKINQVWASDITYVEFVKLQNTFVYLAAIIDIYSRKIVGCALSRNINSQLCIDALSMALINREINRNSDLIHHSDRGVQYSSGVYTEILRQYGLHISMSRKGNPYDNAFIESFFKTLKQEEVYAKEYYDKHDVLMNIEKFIVDVYNIDCILELGIRHQKRRKCYRMLKRLVWLYQIRG